MLSSSYALRDDPKQLNIVIVVNKYSFIPGKLDAINKDILLVNNARISKEVSDSAKFRKIQSLIKSRIPKKIQIQIQNS